MVSEQDLIGAWQLIAHYYLEDDGSTSEGPLGDDAVGLLIYHQSGHMAASMMRTRPATDGTATYLGSADDFLSYAGRWQLREGAVVHRVSIGSHARVIDTEQVREVLLTDGRLRLRRRLGGPHDYVVMDWQHA
ncbi:lipocalin-like domain-containing protein [Kitasatospora sp. NPDC056651]|uniref:lipocalin-like domain-containing protein n=1 Tax=Kitasatospora sp. NPDC056651 TaxID=3345892 RepID=UPI0036CBC2C5